MNSMQTFPSFSPIEWEIIDHRLTADCIAEVLGEEAPNPETYHPEDVEAIIGYLLARDWITAYDINETLTQDVLRDAIEGSTWFGSMEDAVAFGEITPQKAGAYSKAADRIEAKFEECFGERVSLPRL